MPLHAYALQGASGVQLTGHTVVEMEGDDEASMAVEQTKNDLGLRLIRSVFYNEPHKVYSADHLSPSSIHWARVVGHVCDMGWGGADPYRIAKLVQAGSQPRGASVIDRRLKGALAWQAEDKTYSMTGKSEGRVMWSPPAPTRQASASSSYESRFDYVFSPPAPLSRPS